MPHALLLLPAFVGYLNAEITARGGKSRASESETEAGNVHELWASLLPFAPSSCLSSLPFFSKIATGAHDSCATAKGKSTQNKNVSGAEGKLFHSCSCRAGFSCLQETAKTRSRSDGSRRFILPPIVRVLCGLSALWLNNFGNYERRPSALSRKNPTRRRFHVLETEFPSHASRLIDQKCRWSGRQSCSPFRIRTKTKTRTRKVLIMVPGVWLRTETTTAASSTPPPTSTTTAPAKATATRACESCDQVSEAFTGTLTFCSAGNDQDAFSLSPLRNERKKLFVINHKPSVRVWAFCEPLASRHSN